MALFDLESPEVGGGMEIMEELAGMEKPETGELPETDQERKNNIERFRKYGYVIDQSIEDAFITMKTERFSYMQNGVTKKYSRLVPIFDLSKAGGKTIEELNAKVYGDNSEKVLSRKWKGGYVGMMEKGKIVYKSRKSMNFSAKNLITETNDQAAKPKTSNERSSTGVDHTSTTTPNFNDWIKTEQDLSEGVVIPHARKGSVKETENTQPLNISSEKSPVQPELMQSNTTPENVVFSEKLQSLFRVLDISQVNKSDYQLLESIITGITNESSDTYKKIVFKKFNHYCPR